MISTISDFLEEFRKISMAKIQEEDGDIEHRPTIGNMFEGLTSELLNRAIFRNFDLRIVTNSFAYNDKGELSNEIDCMLVVGKGKRISFTEQYKYHFKDVIAVFQVKKKLYADDIISSHNNLESIIKISQTHEPEPFVGNLLRNAYRSLVGKEYPTIDRRKRFSDREQLIHSYLMMEAYHPLRIVIGYYGYSSEFNFREGFVNKLEEMTKAGPVDGFSPGSFPSLYICRNFSVIKNNGMPMGIPLTDDEFYFHILTSSVGKPMYHLLELIWTRLSYIFEISDDIFGDDFDVERAHPFLSCRERKLSNTKWGWEYFYHHIKPELLEQPLKFTPYTPVEIEKDHHILLNVLLSTGSIDLDSKEFLDGTKHMDRDRIINYLIDSRLIFEDENTIQLLVDELVIVFHTDGKTYAGENKSGEMNSYFMKHLRNDKNNIT